MRKKLTDKKLIELFEDQRLTTSRIGALYGYSRGTIRRRLRSLGVERGSVNTALQLTLSDDLLADLYQNQRLTTGEIGKLYGYTPQGVLARLKALGVYRGSKKTASHKKLLDKKLVELYQDQQLTPKRISELYGYTPGRIRQRLKALGVKRARLDPEVLQHLYVNLRLPKDQIATKLGITVASLGGHLVRNGIKRKSALEHLATIHGRTEIETLYIKQGLSQDECAARLEMETNRFRQLLNYLGIDSRHPQGRQGSRSRQYKIDSDELNRLYVEERLTVSSIARIYGCSKPVIWRNLKKLGLSKSLHGDKLA